jgi:hypothetical protein
LVDVCNLPFLEEIRDRIEFFEARSLNVWIRKNRPQAYLEHVVEAFMFWFGLDRSCIQVSRYHLTDFLVSILDRDVFEELTGHVSFSYGGRQFHLHRWSPRDQATRAAMRYYLKICLEGLWSESFAVAVIGRSGSIHYAEEHSRRRESTEVFELMAWSVDPTAIPLRVWLTVLDPYRSSHGSPSVTIHMQCPLELKRGMMYEVILHILTIEDTRHHGADGRPLFYPFRFSLGSADKDQTIAPTPVLWVHSQGQGGDQPLERLPARQSCSAEY